MTAILLLFGRQHTQCPLHSQPSGKRKLRAQAGQHSPGGTLPHAQLPNTVLLVDRSTGGRVGEGWGSGVLTWDSNQAKKVLGPRVPLVPWLGPAYPFFHVLASPTPSLILGTQDD